MTTLEQSSGKSPQDLKFEDRAKKTALSRWKLESLTGLLGLRALQHHQTQSELNQSAENAHVRRKVWGSDESEASQASEEKSMPGHTILGDVMQPAPIIFNTPPQAPANGMGKTIAIAAATVAMGILLPGLGLVGGYMLNKMLNPPSQAVPGNPNTDTSVNVGLGRIGDLLPKE